MNKPHDCSTCAFARHIRATSGAAHLGQAPEEASYYCCIFECVVGEHDLGDCDEWVDVDTLPRAGKGK